MYIDSPQFVRRRVLQAKDNSSPLRNASPNPQKYEYGLERSLLAKHVSDRLNAHDQDNEILQKFRKEAENLKKQKWLSKKYPSPQPKAESFNIKSKSQNVLKMSEELAYPKIQPATSIILREPTPELRQIHRHRAESPSKNVEIVQHYEHLLKSKQAKLKKKDRKLKKSKELIEEMQRKIKQLERQKEHGKREEELQVQRINMMIEEMNFKIASNRAIFQQELAKLKDEEILTNRKIPSKHQKYEPAPIIKRKQFSSNRLQSQRILHTPSIFYELPSNSRLSVNNKNLSNFLQYPFA